MAAGILEADAVVVGRGNPELQPAESDALSLTLLLAVQHCLAHLGAAAATGAGAGGTGAGQLLVYVMCMCVS